MRDDFTSPKLRREAYRYIKALFIKPKNYIGLSMLKSLRTVLTRGGLQGKGHDIAAWHA